jgi:hypothetical protein
MATNARQPWSEVKAREMTMHPEVFAAYEAFKQAVKDGHRISPERPLIVIDHPDNLPLFASEDEEHEYWGTHEMDDAFFEGATLDDDERMLIERARRRRQRVHRTAG